MGLRELVYDLLRTDPELNALGIKTETLHSSYAEDPARSVRRWVVLKWGVEGPRVGRDSTARPRDLEVWAYDRESDFSAVNAILDRAVLLITAIEAAPTGDGWVIGVTDNGGSEDFRTPEYGTSTVARNWGFTIHSSKEE